MATCKQSIVEDMKEKERNAVDTLIGENLARLRGDTTQEALAQLMKERGHKWSQNTVWLVEQGKRPLRFTEAQDLSTILGFYNLDMLTRQPEVLSAASAVRHFVRELSLARERAVESLAKLLEAQDNFLVGAMPGVSGEYRKALDEMTARNLDSFYDSELLVLVVEAWQEGRYYEPGEALPDFQEQVQMSLERFGIAPAKRIEYVQKELDRLEGISPSGRAGSRGGYAPQGQA